VKNLPKVAGSGSGSGWCRLDVVDIDLKFNVAKVAPRRRGRRAHNLHRLGVDKLPRVTDGRAGGRCGSGWCRLDVVDLSAGRHLDDYGRSLEVDAYILAFDVTSIQAAGSAHRLATLGKLSTPICAPARKTAHGLGGQHRDVDRTARGRVRQSDRGRR